VTASYQGWRAGRRVAGLLAARRPVLGGATPTGKSRGCGVAGAGVYNPRLDSTRLAPFSSICQVAVLNPLSSEYPLLLKLGEGGALHFYTSVAAYVRDTYNVPVGESTSWRRRTGGHPCAQFTCPQPPQCIKPPPPRRSHALYRRSLPSPAPSARRPAFIYPPSYHGKNIYCPLKLYIPWS